jgi:hypothetical protein
MLRPEFGSFDGRVWLNSATRARIRCAPSALLSEPLSRRSPHPMQEELFWEVPRASRR